LLSIKVIACAIGLSLAFGAAQASAKQPSTTSVVAASGDAVLDLGALPPTTEPDNPTPASASTVGVAEPVPELSTWTMILLCFAGLGLAGFRRGRKDRLSTGLE
jgi:hypothetical protein